MHMFDKIMASCNGPSKKYLAEIYKSNNND